MTDTVTTTDRELTTDEIDRIAGGLLGEAIKQGVLAGGQGAQGRQNDPAQMFAQILQQMTQGQG